MELTMEDEQKIDKALKAFHQVMQQAQHSSQHQQQQQEEQQQQQQQQQQQRPASEVFLEGIAWVAAGHEACAAVLLDSSKGCLVVSTNRNDHHAVASYCIIVHGTQQPLAGGTQQQLDFEITIKTVPPAAPFEGTIVYPSFSKHVEYYGPVKLQLSPRQDRFPGLTDLEITCLLQETAVSTQPKRLKFAEFQNQPLQRRMTGLIEHLAALAQVVRQTEGMEISNQMRADLQQHRLVVLRQSIPGRLAKHIFGDGATLDANLDATNAAFWPLVDKLVERYYEEIVIPTNEDSKAALQRIYHRFRQDHAAGGDPSGWGTPDKHVNRIRKCKFIFEIVEALRQLEQFVFNQVNEQRQQQQQQQEPSSDIAARYILDILEHALVPGEPGTVRPGTFEIYSELADGVHAEMRLLKYIADSDSHCFRTSDWFLGISFATCPYCSLVVAKFRCHGHKMCPLPKTHARLYPWVLDERFMDSAFWRSILGPSKFAAIEELRYDSRPDPNSLERVFWAQLISGTALQDVQTRLGDTTFNWSSQLSDVDALLRCTSQRQAIDHGVM